ncbi:MAG TPA: hypothetical protein PKD78_17075, partial [Saprospiraceae bacterium]|nr:hypothetical protein [Saprospiraceae bacterium]
SDPFNSRGEVVRLLDYLSRFVAPGTEPAEARRRSAAPALLSKEAAYAWAMSSGTDAERRSAAPAQAYDDGKMRHLMAYSLEVIRLYLAWEDWKSDPAQVALHLCQALKKRGLDALFERDHQRALAIVDARPDRSATHYYQHFTLESDAWQLYRATQRTHEGQLQHMASSFGAYVAIHTLRQGCAALAQRTVSEQQTAIPYLAETLRLVEQGAFGEAPAVQMYAHCYRVLSDPDDQHSFSLIKAALEEGISIFPEDELRDLYILAINFCIRQLNAGQRQYIQEAFHLYRLGLDRRVFLENAALSRFTYRNILNLALALGEWEWSLEYLHEFAAYLPAKDR